MAKVELINVCKQFKQKVLFSQLNLTIEEGTCVGIVGENGSGKSILFKLISGLEASDAGVIKVNGKEVGKDLPYPENLGLLVNQPGYLEYYNGFQNLKLLAQIRGKVSPEQIRLSMRRIGLNPDDPTKVRKYSMGMRQKLGIVQAVMEDQDLILLDEPFNALDFQSYQDLAKLLHELKAEGKTILLTSHQHQMLEVFADELYLITEQRLQKMDEALKQRYFTYTRTEES